MTYSITDTEYFHRPVRVCHTAYRTEQGRSCLRTRRHQDLPLRSPCAQGDTVLHISRPRLQVERGKAETNALTITVVDESTIMLVIYLRERCDGIASSRCTGSPNRGGNRGYLFLQPLFHLTYHSGQILILASCSWIKGVISRRTSALLLSSSPKPQGGMLLAANLRATPRYLSR